MGKQKDIAG